MPNVDPSQSGSYNPKAHALVPKLHPKREQASGRGRPSLLTPEVLRIICDNIRQGSFIWVACQAAGINTDTYNFWVRRGRVGEQPYKDFVDAVEQAQADARVAAEKSVFAVNPLAWLKMGPGRDRPGRPGWSDRPVDQPAPGSDAPVRVTLNLGEHTPEPPGFGPSGPVTDLSPEEERLIEVFLLPSPAPAPRGPDPLDDS